MKMITINKDTYRWHPALEALRDCGHDPMHFDALIDHCINLGNTPSKVLVCTYPFDTGEDYAVISNPLHVDAYFVAYKYGHLDVEVIDSPDDVIKHMANEMRHWPKLSAVYESDFVLEVKMWLKMISYGASSDASLGSLLGVSRSVITNLLRLQNLDTKVRDYVAINVISLSKARTLASLDISAQRRLAKLCVDLNWSYRTLYEKAFPNSARKDSKKAVLVKSPDVLRFERVASAKSGLDLSYEPTTDNMSKGVLRIKFGTLGEMERLLALVTNGSDSEMQKGEMTVDIENMMQLERIFKNLLSDGDR